MKNLQLFIFNKIFFPLFDRKFLIYFFNRPLYLLEVIESRNFVVVVGAGAYCSDSEIVAVDCGCLMDFEIGMRSSRAMNHPWSSEHWDIAD
jgi:hypothetical protein